MKLYPHQREAVAFLEAKRHAILADDQGLGKTISALVALRAFRRLSLATFTHDGPPESALLVVPTVVAYNWKAEAKQWLPGVHVQVLQSLRDRIDRRATIVVATHRQIIAAKIWRQITGRHWGTLIVDEVHAFRNPSAQRTRALYGPARPNRLVDCATRAWVLTGTLNPNTPADLWTHLHGLWPEKFPETFIEFRDKYCKLAYSPHTADNVKIVGGKNLAELRRRMKGLYLRRLKSDVLKDLPPMRHEQIVLRPEKMPGDVVKLSRSIREQLDMAGADSPEEAFQLLGDLQEFSTWRRVCGMAKVDPVAELVSAELEAGLDCIVVACWHKSVALALAKRLAAWRPVTIMGKTPARHRTEAVRRFQAGQSDVCIVQIQAGGVGITLTRAREIVFAELSFAPGDNAQCCARIHRIGQKRHARARYVALAGTVDVPVTTVLRRKAAMEVIR